MRVTRIQWGVVRAPDAETPKHTPVGLRRRLITYDVVRSLRSSCFGRSCPPCDGQSVIEVSGEPAGAGGLVAIAVDMGHGAEQSIAVDGVTGQTREDLVKLL